MNLSPELIATAGFGLVNLLVILRVRLAVAEMKNYMHEKFEPKHSPLFGARRAEYERSSHGEVSGYER